MPTRRQFLATSAAALAAATLSRRALANPLGLPLGLQLYSVRELLAKDYDGTLKQLAALGFREVESAGFFGKTPDQVKASMSAAGISLVSAHHPFTEWDKSADEIIDYSHQLGIQYIICSFPGIKDPSRLPDKSYKSMITAFNLDDYRYNAEKYNDWGRKVKAAGMKFGYHNHTMEFAAMDGKIPMKEMIRLTDPALVTFELDCGWVTVGGADPVEYLREFPTRISMLHVKDFKPASRPVSVIDPPDAAELGTGTSKYRPIFEEAKKHGNIRHAFVEQEAYDKPVYEALKIDADYFKSLTV